MLQNPVDCRMTRLIGPTMVRIEVAFPRSPARRSTIAEIEELDDVVDQSVSRTLAEHRRCGAELVSHLLDTCRQWRGLIAEHQVAAVARLVSLCRNIEAQEGSRCSYR